MKNQLLLFNGSGKPDKARQIPLSDWKGKDEAWLRDMLFDNTDAIPVDEIDPAFGPLIPLCKELRTDGGRIDAIFANQNGYLTILECKLWRNPEARRQVLAQVIDYVSQLDAWSYAHLEQQVCAAAGARGSTLCDMVRRRAGKKIEEQHFVKSVNRSLRDGRFLVLVAGDGIHQGVESVVDLLNRYTSRRFSFGLIECAIYKFGNNRVAVHPRVAAKTETVTITVVNSPGGGPAVIETDREEPPKRSGKKHLEAWWQPVLKMTFDKSDQEPPSWVATNNVVLKTPFPGIQIKAYSARDRNQIGVFLSGKKASVIGKFLKRERSSLLKALPVNTEIRLGAGWPIVVANFDLETDADKQAWIKKHLNTFVNVLRPRLRKWYEEVRA
jgi:hypothetical protein